MVKKHLGRGLDALIPTGTDETGEDGETTSPGESRETGVYQLSIDKIHANRWQPRQDFDETSIEGLAASISSSGILQPIVVQKTNEGYELIAGERRLRAAKKLNWDTIPAIITNVSENRRLQLSLVENIQRENLNAMEEALAYQNLQQIINCTQEELAETVGKERSTVSNSLRLLKLPVEIQKHLREGLISSGHARAILALSNSQEQHYLCQLIVDKGLSVREAEEYAKRQSNRPKSAKPKDVTLNPVLQTIQEEMTQRLATRVKIAPASRGKGGKITIEYYSDDDLERFLQIIHN